MPATGHKGIIAAGGRTRALPLSYRAPPILPDAQSECDRLRVRLLVATARGLQAMASTRRRLSPPLLAVRALPHIPALELRVLHPSFPGCIRGFDSFHPLHRPFNAVSRVDGRR